MPIATQDYEDDVLEANINELIASLDEPEGQTTGDEAVGEDRSEAPYFVQRPCLNGPSGLNGRRTACQANLVTPIVPHIAQEDDPEPAPRIARP